MRKYRRGEVLKIKIASYFSQMGPKSFSYILPTSNYLVFSFLQRECYRNHLFFLQSLMAQVTGMVHEGLLLPLSTCDKDVLCPAPYEYPRKPTVWPVTGSVAWVREKRFLP